MEFVAQATPSRYSLAPDATDFHCIPPVFLEDRALVAYGQAKLAARTPNVEQRVAGSRWLAVPRRAAVRRDHDVAVLPHGHARRARGATDRLKRVGDTGVAAAPAYASVGADLDVAPTPTAKHTEVEGQVTPDIPLLDFSGPPALSPSALTAVTSPRPHTGCRRRMPRSARGHPWQRQNHGCSTYPCHWAQPVECRLHRQPGRTARPCSICPRRSSIECVAWIRHVGNGPLTGSNALLTWSCVAPVARAAASR